MTPHPDSKKLEAALGSIVGTARPWKGDLFRYALPKWSTREELLTGKGARKKGGRWNPIDSFATVYLSTEPETALAEALANNRRAGIPVSQAMPLMATAVEVSLSRVLDLTEAVARRILDLTKKRLDAEQWWLLRSADPEAYTQAVGRLALGLGLEGLLLPSTARPGGVNLAYFPDNHVLGSTLEIVNADELPPFPKK